MLLKRKKNNICTKNIPCRIVPSFPRESSFFILPCPFDFCQYIVQWLIKSLKASKTPIAIDDFGTY